MDADDHDDGTAGRGDGSSVCPALREVEER